MQIVAALRDLGFNFWQAVVVFIVLLFRNEIRQVLDRIKSFKLAGGELALQETDVGLVRELKKIESEASESKVTVEELRNEISSVLKRRCIAALLQIRTLTSVLWPHLKNLGDGQAVLIVDIRNSTFKEIEQSVRLLSAAGMFDFSLLPARELDEIQKMRLFDIHPLFKSLVKEAESY
jgi:hypothetical protein